MILQRGDYILLSQYEDHPYAPRTHQTPTAEIQIGSWQHVIVRYDGDTVKIYINGVLKVDDVAGLFPVTTTNIVVGSSNEFTGAIDDVRIYDWAVPEYWITDLYVPVQ
jgi:hypothetical protein